MRPWLLGLLTTAVVCGPYFLMAAYRKAWQAHYPELASRWANDGPFTILGIVGTENGHDELDAAARANEASRRLRTVDPFVKDNRSRRLLAADYLDYFVLGGLQRLTGDMNRTWLLARCLFTCLWFVLLWRIALELGCSPPAAEFCAFFLCCFSYLLTLLFVRNLDGSGGPAHVLLHSAWSMLSFGRTDGVVRLPRPGMNYAAFFAANLLIVKAWRDPRWRWSAAAGLWGGLLAYVRPDVWTTYMCAAGLFAAVASLRQGRACWRLVFSTALALLVSLPWLAFNYPLDHELLLRSAARFHPPFQAGCLFYLAAALLLLRLKRGDWLDYLACVLGGVFVMTNLHLITGVSVQPDHWIFLGNVYVFLAALALVPRTWQDRPRPWVAGSALALGLCAMQGLSYAALHFPFYGLPKDYADAIAWLRANTAPDSVVLALDPEVNELIAAFSRNKVTVAETFPLYSDLPLADNARRFLAGLKVYGADIEAVERRVFSSDGESYDRRQLDAGRRDIAVDPELRQYLFLGMPSALVRPILRQAEPLSDPSSLGADYVWAGWFERKEAGAAFPDRGPLELAEVYRNRSVSIYRAAGGAGRKRGQRLSNPAEAPERGLPPS